MNEPPIDGEEEVDYMRRCMKSFGDQDVDNEEKASICLASFRGDSKGSKDILSRIDFHLCCSKYLTDIEIGYEEELTEANFYIPEVSEYEDFGEETEEVSASSLWENIRNKKKKLGKNYKPAKPGDKDRPDPKSWKKAQSGESDTSYSSEYQGRTVTLNKPFRTPKGPKKFSVYTKNEKGNVVKVNFGDPMSSIKRDNPARRKSFRARHNCDNAGPKWKANFWSCRQWRANSPVEAKGDK